ncbi:MAG: 16S rRNA (cytidine(1402)-2'-O)-methyltransferase [Christensenellaceae bacterium]|jgi:16S rRNA (cytidine1402-2'-O)-methyltransferase|nr:16S rRNA (cytidine(1402)-2'-O)-methyltransferase [Christensenellaceae bacterium]
MEHTNKIGTCYLVGTPIGNLKDITLRALETLRSVDVIAAEDTRHTGVLLNHYEINKPLISCHEHNERAATLKIKDFLNSGKSVAIVSDAGMPGISDPGAYVARTLRNDGYLLTVIPGPSALTSAVSLVGLVDGAFLFLGFLPEKLQHKKTMLSPVKDLPWPVVFYSAPHNIVKDILFLYNTLGDRKVYVIKELTKVFETVYEGTLSNVNIENTKGEFVLIIEPPLKSTISDELILDEISLLLNNKITTKSAVEQVATKYSISKNSVYSLYLKNSCIKSPIS